MSRKSKVQCAVFYLGMTPRDNGGIKNQTQLHPVGTSSQAAPAAPGHSSLTIPLISSLGANCNYSVARLPPRSTQPAPKSEHGHCLAEGTQVTPSSPSAHPAQALLEAAEGNVPGPPHPKSHLGHLDVPAQQSDCRQLSSTLQRGKSLGVLKIPLAHSGSLFPRPNRRESPVVLVTGAVFGASLSITFIPNSIPLSEPLFQLD